MKIVVLGGGNTGERDVSLRSAKAVSDALVQSGFEVVNLDPADSNFLESIPSDSIVFPILHGVNYEDGRIQKDLEEKGLPYLGSTSAPSMICFNKNLTREAFIRSGVPVADGESVTKETYKLSRLFKNPHVLKASESGSSIGVYLVTDPELIDDSKVSAVFDVSDEAVIEELVVGTEVTVPVLDGKALPIIEIIPPENEEFDYSNKYNGKTQEICPPRSVSDKVQAELKELAETAHRELDCRHLSRTDFIIGDDGRIVALEINTLPGMTNQSLFPLAAKTAGLEFTELVKEFVRLVKRDYKLE